MQKIIDRLQKKNRFFLKTVGQSMYPLLHSDDVVYFKKTSYKKIGINDLVVVKKNNHFLTHRVIYKTKKYLVTKGDNNLQSDGKIYSQNIMGKVYQIKRNGQVLDPENIYLIQSTLYFQEIVKIKKEFEKQKIKFVVLKGLPLHLYYERTHPRKVYADCDILVAKKNKEPVEKILKKLHYSREKRTLYKKFQKFIGADLKEITYYKKIGSFFIAIEVHFELTFLTHKVPLPFPFLQDKVNLFSNLFFNKRVFVKIQGNFFPILEHNYLISYLLLHFFFHFWGDISRLNFINLVVKKRPLKINWEKIIQILETGGFLNFVIPGLFLLKKYYGIGSPFSILKKKNNKKLNYSLFVYRLIGAKKYLFSNLESVQKGRLMKAIVIVLLTDKNLLIKLVYLCNPKWVLYFIYFLMLLVKQKISAFLKKEAILF